MCPLKMVDLSIVFCKRLPEGNVLYIHMHLVIYGYYMVIRWFMMVNHKLWLLYGYYGY